MIADKIIPSFYVIDLEGAAANLQFLVGTEHNIRKVFVNSADFDADVLAAAAAAKALSFFKRNLPVEIETTTFNAEFFPTQPAIEPTLEQLNEEEAIEEETEKLEEHGRNVAVAMTRRFDEWGDFVASKTSVEGDGYSIKMKVAVHPQQYMLEKNLEKQEYVARLHGHRTSAPSVHIH